MLTVSGLSGGYGGSQVLFDLDLSVEAGSVLALVGRNGAGKSTTFKTIAGQLRGWSGRIQLDGHDLSGLPPHVIARRGIGYVPEDRQVFAELTVADNIAIAEKPPAAGADRRWSKNNIYDVFPALKPLKNRPAGRLSGGEQQMLTIARTLVGNPALLLLDEPSEGLAPKIVTAIAELVEQIAGTGTTVIMAEQNLAFCMRTASAVTIMERGCIVYRGSMSTLRNDERIRRQYLAV